MSLSETGNGRPIESVWDYPRPPLLERIHDPIEIEAAGCRIAESQSALRCLETSHPPVYYLCESRFVSGALVPIQGRGSWCEFKGHAQYFDILVKDTRIPRAAWTYPDPSPQYADLVGMVAVYPSLMSACRVAGERVQPQEGDFYGGWITSWIKGPFKGGPGTMGW